MVKFKFKQYAFTYQLSRYVTVVFLFSFANKYCYCYIFIKLPSDPFHDITSLIHSPYCSPSTPSASFNHQVKLLN